MPMHYTTSTALHVLDRWVRTGERPPRTPRYEFTEDGELAKDRFGNTKGGIRLPPAEVPVARYESTACDLGGITVRITVVWWLVFVALASWILLRTRVGNWIFAAGGNAASARAVGVPVDKVKIGLFMGVAFLAWFYGMHNLFAFNTVQSGGGVGNEFIYIIAAVVGGCLLTGGYGSAIGAAIGAFIFGMTTQGIVFAGFDPNWFFTFLGAMLLLAVMLNLYVKNYALNRRS